MPQIWSKQTLIQLYMRLFLFKLPKLCENPHSSMMTSIHSYAWIHLCLMRIPSLMCLYGFMIPFLQFHCLLHIFLLILWFIILGNQNSNRLPSSRVFSSYQPQCYIYKYDINNQILTYQFHLILSQSWSRKAYLIECVSSSENPLIRSLEDLLPSA